jgi:hypothetical protein
MLGDEFKHLAVQGPDKACLSNVKLPLFDLKRDLITFKQWKDIWTMVIKARLIHLIIDEEEHRKHCLKS